MTPEEIAKELAAKWFVSEPYMYGDRAPELVADIAQTIRDAYERAASLCDGMSLIAAHKAATVISEGDTNRAVADVAQSLARQICALKGTP